MPDLRAKALGYYRDGRIVTLHARTSGADRAPCEVVAVIAPSVGTPGSTVQTVQLLAGAWSCSCKAVTDDGLPCAHVEAVKMATGHPSLAAKPAKARRDKAA